MEFLLNIDIGAIQALSLIVDYKQVLFSLDQANWVKGLSKVITDKKVDYSANKIGVFELWIILIFSVNFLIIYESFFFKSR